MNWVNKHKLPEVKAVKYNGCLCLKIEDFWHALHLSLNMAQNHQINIEILDEIPSIASSPWVLFSEEEFISSIAITHLPLALISYHGSISKVLLRTKCV